MGLTIGLEDAVGEQTASLVAFLVTLASFSMGLTFIPLLPQPLPFVVAFLVAFATHQNKQVGMTLGSLLIGLGLVYHLSRIGFFNLFHGSLVKVLVLSVFIAPFALCPAMVVTNLHVIALDIGMVAACLLFFESTFYLAVPLIIVFATIYRGRGIVFSFIYYICISVPLQVIQYLKTFQVGVLPPIYTPLNLVYRDIQGSLAVFNLQELAKVWRSITLIFTSQGFEGFAGEAPRYLSEGLAQYLKTEYAAYIRSAPQPPPSAPGYIHEAFTRLLGERLPTYASSHLGPYLDSSLPAFFTNNLDPQIWSSLPEVPLQTLQAQVEELFPALFNHILQAYIHDATSHLVNSLPGILLFLVIMVGLTSALTYANMVLPDPKTQGGRYVNLLAYLGPVIMAGATNLAFFLSVTRLQGPLSFQAAVDQGVLVSSTLFNLAFSAPVGMVKYVSDLKEVRNLRQAHLLERCDELEDKLSWLQSVVGRVSRPIPPPLLDVRTRILISLDEVRELRALTLKALDISEVDQGLKRVESLWEEVGHYYSEVDAALMDHYIRTKFEYLEALGEISDIGLTVSPRPLPEPDPSQGLESKLECIEAVVEAGRELVKELLDTSDKIYEIISSLFEPTLPRDSATLIISSEKVEEDEPWVIVDAILASLRNWERQYSADIVKATRPIKDSVEAVVRLSQREELRGLLGEGFQEIHRMAQRLGKTGVEEGLGGMKVLRVVLIRDTILNTIEAVSRVVGVLYNRLRELEFIISTLLPREDYEWNRNQTLAERMSQSLEVISNYEAHRIDELIGHLYRALSYIDEAVDTIQYYVEVREMLLNYPVFSKKITRLLEEEGEARLSRLGVGEKYGREYLKIYLRTTPGSLEETAEGLRRVG